ncbi:lymphoid-specific helicase-like isoform X2 [Chelonus insularis]|uniref:lymphoid-specific helicase-like isoform X2 n=1 Tax=Chelonus insularis TaxID=460826 RepID=UPI00158A54B9|nr:lymphoid-specific helicase-like isoform X2 [Chelonus insularis]
MEENTTNYLEGIGQAEDSGFASLAGTGEIGKSSHNFYCEDIKLTNQPILNDTELDKASKGWKYSEAKRQLDEEYNKESEQKNTRNNRKKTFETDTDEEYIPPIKKKIKNDNSGYNLRESIPVKGAKKKKLNLSNDEIEKELNADSDEETPRQTENVDICLKYFTGELRDYQKVGVKWLISLYENGLNGILADEMGLGKTIQVIAMICYLIEKREAGPFLIIVPLSTAPNWLSEFERFAPEVPVILLHGTPQKRDTAIRQMNTKKALSNGYKTLPVIVTTYQVALADIHRLRKHNWRYIVIDEGHRLKNHQAQLSQAVRTLKSISRLILTGTPLQNNLAELWALLNFLMPDIFDDLAVFESWFDVNELQNTKNAERFLKQEKEKQVIACLREILKPFMLRREKDDVCKDIPKKKEVLVYTPISELQRELYLAVLKLDYEFLSMKEKKSEIIPDNPDGSRPKRKCTINCKYSQNYFDPFAVLNQSSTTFIPRNNSSNEILTEPIKNKDQLTLPTWNQFGNIDDRNMNYIIRVRTGSRVPIYKQIISHPFLIRCPLDDCGLPTINELMVKASGKLLVLDLMLKKLYPRGHKVLLFSTMTALLDLVADYLTMRPWKFVRLDGRIHLDERSTSIEQFNNDPETFLFLISTRAGGVGLNLTAADTVIIYDSDWNPQADIQAMARCHRIGQTRPVVIYRLCSKGTIDETIITRAESKRKLEKMVISKELADLNFNKAETILELQKLLESTEHSVIKSENDVYSEAELDALLDRSDLLPKNQTED